MVQAIKKTRGDVDKYLAIFLGVQECEAVELVDALEFAVRQGVRMDMLIKVVEQYGAIRKLGAPRHDCSTGEVCSRMDGALPLCIKDCSFGKDSEKNEVCSDGK